MQTLWLKPLESIFERCTCHRRSGWWFLRVSVGEQISSNDGDVGAWREPRIFNGARLDRTHALCLSSPRERDDLKLAVDDLRDFAVKREMLALFGPALSERLDGCTRGGDHQPFR